MMEPFGWLFFLPRGIEQGHRPQDSAAGAIASRVSHRALEVAKPESGTPVQTRHRAGAGAPLLEASVPRGTAPQLRGEKSLRAPLLEPLVPVAALDATRRGEPFAILPPTETPVSAPPAIDMVTSTTYSSGELLSSFSRHPTGLLQPMPHLAMQPSAPMPSDQTQKRSPLLCGYPSKKCWSWRVEKRNGELHKFCEYHRQKANTNQRRMEQRRKQGRSASPRAKSSSGSRRPHKVAADVKREIVLKVERIPKAMTHPKAVVVTPALNAGSPRGIDCFAVGMDDAAMFSWMDAELDIGIGMDAAVDYMMVDTPVIDMEPSDTPVDLFEEDLFFLEHFIDEISHSAV
ncbi:hypothetical protein PRNP1_009973 [Phytophthora ramorum]|nr:hypothetical protein KRP23_11087 [Phytophthora ramorum]